MPTLNWIGKEKVVNHQTIYVQLLGEGTVCYRPTQGKLVSKGVYKLLPIKDYDPKDEKWEFKPDSIVKCEEKHLSIGQVLVAVELA